MEESLDNKRARDHFIFITDPKRGYLRGVALRDGIITLDIPENVGGRFSVLSAAGLLPAALVGVDVKKLFRGARRAVQYFFETNSKKNMAFQLARVQFLLQQKRGVTITVMMPYSHALTGVSEWYAQLLAESIGKSHTRSGEIVHAGITPVSAIGVTDQHSQVQLYNEGPFDKFVLFLETRRSRSDISVPKISEKSFDFLSGVPFGDLMRVEKRATESAFVRFDRPCGSVILERIDEEHLGELLVMLEGSVAFLGEMYGVNTYDQPGVELGKTLTKKILRAGL
jgi:glucose-6-phosphate isomerase